VARPGTIAIPISIPISIYSQLLNHYLDMDWLREAYGRTHKDSAPGVDDETAGQFALELDTRLADLLERAKSGR
jgi:hypothetical protein